MYERFTGRAEGAQCQSNLFVIGEKAEAYPDLIKKIQDDGHIIGNHSYTHGTLASYQRKMPVSRFERPMMPFIRLPGNIRSFCVLLSEAPEESGLSDEYDRGALGCRPKGLGGAE